MVNVNFIGRLGADAEEKLSPQGTPLLSFNVAVNEYNKTERTTSWLRCAYFGERAMKMKEFLTKGRLVHVFGTERVSIYNGNTATGPLISRDVICYNIDFISSGQSREDGQEPVMSTVTPPKQNATASVTQQPVVEPAPSAAPAFDNDSDDLPF